MVLRGRNNQGGVFNHHPFVKPIKRFDLLKHQSFVKKRVALQQAVNV